MNMEENNREILNDKELSYEQLNQIKEHSKKYDYVSDKKEFLKTITPYEQKLVLLDTINPYEVLSYLDEIDFENSRLVLNQLDSSETRKIIDKFSAEDKKKFYATFSDLELVNKFIIHDKNSKEHITNLKTDRKVEILNSSKIETVEAAAKVYDTIDESEREMIIDDIDTLEAKFVINAVATESVNEKDEIQEEIPQQEIPQQEIPQQEEPKENLEESIEQMKPEELMAINDFIKSKMDFYKNISEFSNIDFSDNDLYLKLSDDLKGIIDKDFNLFKEEANKENLELFQQAKTNCEQEIIAGVINSIETEVKEETNEKTL